MTRDGDGVPRAVTHAEETAKAISERSHVSCDAEGHDCNNAPSAAPRGRGVVGAAHEQIQNGELLVQYCGKSICVLSSSVAPAVQYSS
jgi:hypothetical protein